MYDLSSIEGLRKACKAEKPDRGWRENIQEFLEKVKAYSLEERKRTEFHQLIWNENIIVNAKQGEIPVDSAIRKRSLRLWLAEKSMQPLPDDRQERLDTLENIHHELLKRVMDSGMDRTPRLKTTRLLAALFPRDFTVLFTHNFLNEVLEKMGIKPQGSVPSKHRQVLDKLDEALGTVPDEDLKQVVLRMTWPIVLKDLTNQGESTEQKATDESGEMPQQYSKKLLSYSDTFSDGNLYHGDTNHVFGGSCAYFKVLGQATKSTQPSQGSFDDPAFGHHLESLGWFIGYI